MVITLNDFYDCTMQEIKTAGAMCFKGSIYFELNELQFHSMYNATVTMYCFAILIHIFYNHNCRNFTCNS